ncbi:hypothetical protein [Salmonella enterica]|uniref:Cytoplasmic protein n=2 Tax=Salmonella enterica TaxID=28901 RepID=A0A379QQK5_SALER|nr:hypothetical protein [Salmonella enterica]ECC1482006.1 hypothetical protein [Salmonella enterica subsp. salamae]EHM1750008.1 hypothetical protein [Salmonella enterica subsp. salamae serovar 40:c:e,n,x,z15]HCM1999746.1 hypothetical protein [Salmonella enterica subsp. salamae serovar [1],40:z35:e,n,x,z15]ASG89984.1 hypothetical protein LFZ47_21890 [Salmonella enterica subsp. salamae serovar 55:k:z39 str. 1315K]ECC1656158.1 hypothetical protein [Salmonella enterica subsp. salamae]
MDNTYIGEQIRVSTRHTNNLKKWRDNDHISHILFNLSRDLYDGETQKSNNKHLFLKKINHNLLLSLTSPAHRQRVPLSEHHHRKKIIT